jgi:cytochrome P450
VSADYDPLSPRWRDDPYPSYRRLRAEAPVHRAPESGVWCVARHADVLSVLKRTEVFSSRAMFTFLMNGGSDQPPPLNWAGIRMLLRFIWRARMNPIGFVRSRNLIASDPPVHETLRTLVNRGFTPRRIASWEPRVRELTASLLAKLREGAPFDVVRDLAIPLPVTIIAEMLGVEPERRDDFKRWSDLVIEGATGTRRKVWPEAPDAEAMRAMEDLVGYLRRTIRQRRRRPADDLVSIVAGQQEGEVALSTLEVVQFVILLLVAGNETTTNLIANAATALLDHPEQLERVARDPSLVPGLVEETLRFDAPIQMVFRTVTRDAELLGQRIPAGDTVAALIGSANRDERRFAEPDRFDVGRDARGHLGFGFGAHFCLGASLARLEAQVALEALVQWLPRLSRAGAAPERIDSFLVRGPRRLELVRAA